MRCAPKRVRSTRAKALHEVALRQAGYFTTQQAKTAGFKESTHPYHVQRGNWIRVHRGLYRLAVFPESRAGELIGWRLWSRDRKQIPQAVFSHLTALELQGLLSLGENRVFMTVPASFRRTSPTPAEVRLYKAHLSANDVVEVNGIPVTAVTRTFQDMFKSDLIPRDELIAILNRALGLELVEAQLVTDLLGEQFQLRFRK